MRILIYTTLIILFMISHFISGTILDYSIGIIAFIALIISAFYSRGLYLISGVVFLIFGIILFIYNNFPWYTFVLHFKHMLGLLSLFLVLPFINSLIRVGHYDKNLSLLLQDRVTHLSKLYRRSFIVCHFLGLFLNIATISLLTKSLNVTLRQLPRHTLNKFYAQNLLRAYALCLTWSPMEVMISTSIDITKSKYYMILPIVLSIVIITIILDWTISSFKYKDICFSIEDQKEISSKKVYKKATQMLGMLFLFILLVSWIQHILNKGFLISVVLLLIPFSILWAVFIGKTTRYVVLTKRYWKEKIKGLANYFFMFLSAGLFVEMLSHSGSLSILEPIFNFASEKTLLLYLMIGGYFLSISFIGFHPLVSLTFLAELLQPILPKVAPIPLTVVLISCSLSTVMYSPYNLSISILADELKMNPYRMGIWNICFAIFYMLLSISVAFLVEKLFY